MLIDGSVIFEILSKMECAPFLLYTIVGLEDFFHLVYVLEFKAHSTCARPRELLL